MTDENDYCYILKIVNKSLSQCCLTLTRDDRNTNSCVRSTHTQITHLKVWGMTPDTRHTASCTPIIVAPQCVLYLLVAES